jgi:hypothetical protein
MALLVFPGRSWLEMKQDLPGSRPGHSDYCIGWNDSQQAGEAGEVLS